MPPPGCIPSPLVRPPKQIQQLRLLTGHYPVVAQPLLLPLAVSASERTGRVVKAVDDDTVYGPDAGQNQHKIRLSASVLFARGQLFGKKAKDHLADLIAGKAATVDREKQDRWRRIIGKFIHEDQDVNLTMVRTGYIWWYRQQVNEQSPVDQILPENAEVKAQS